MAVMVGKGIASDFPDAIRQWVMRASASELSRSNVEPGGLQVLVDGEQADPEDVDVFAQSWVRGKSLAHERVVDGVPVCIVIEIGEVEKNVVAGELKEMKILLQVEARGVLKTVVQLIGEQHQSRV